MSSRAGMLTAWRALAAAVTELRYVGLYLIGFNLLWFFSSLLVFTLFPATGALYAVTRQLLNRQEVGWRHFFRELRAHLVTGWAWGLLNLFVSVLFAVNFWFYGSLPSSTALVPTALLFGLAVPWIIVQMYCYPILLAQIDTRLGLAVLNSLKLCLKYPLYTLTYALVAGTFIFISVVVPYFWMIFTPALLTFLYNQAVRVLLELEAGKDPFRQAGRPATPTEDGRPDAGRR